MSVGRGWNVRSSLRGYNSIFDFLLLGCLYCFFIRHSITRLFHHLCAHSFECLITPLGNEVGWRRDAPLFQEIDRTCYFWLHFCNGFFLSLGQWNMNWVRSYIWLYVKSSANGAISRQYHRTILEPSAMCLLPHLAQSLASHYGNFDQSNHCSITTLPGRTEYAITKRKSIEKRTIQDA